MAHETAGTDRRIAPEIVEHPDGNKSTKQLERAEREPLQLQNAQRLELNCKLVASQEPGPILNKGAPRAFSVDSGVSKAFVPASPTIQVKILIFGQHWKTLTVPDDVSREELRKRASHEFQGSVAIEPEVFPIRDNSMEICHPSFVPEIG
jgi:hypothetical protein